MNPEWWTLVAVRTATFSRGAFTFALLVRRADVGAAGP